MMCIECGIKHDGRADNNLCPLCHYLKSQPKASQPTGSTLTNADAEFIMTVADWLYLTAKHDMAKQLLHVVLRAGRVE